MKSRFSQGFLLAAGLLATPVVVDSGVHDPSKSYENDERLTRIRQFFHRLGSPAARYAEDFLAAADRHGLDWRLLPSISLLESGGGKRCKGNNWFGWKNGEHRFPSIRQAIHTVADRLANSRLYRDKKLDELLLTYNPNPEYRPRVKSVMRRLGPPEVTAAIAD